MITSGGDTSTVGGAETPPANRSSVIYLADKRKPEQRKEDNDKKRARQGFGTVTGRAAKASSTSKQKQVIDDEPWPI